MGPVLNSWYWLSFALAHGTTLTAGNTINATTNAVNI
jgi:hypothetical protein